jgi:hypothetical protein
MSSASLTPRARPDRRFLPRSGCGHDQRVADLFDQLLLAGLGAVAQLFELLEHVADFAVIGDQQGDGVLAGDVGGMDGGVFRARIVSWYSICCSCVPLVIGWLRLEQ